MLGWAMCVSHVRTKKPHVPTVSMLKTPKTSSAVECAGCSSSSEYRPYCRASSTQRGQRRDEHEVLGLPA